MKVLKFNGPSGPKVFKFDTAYGDEGCVLPLTRRLCCAKAYPHRYRGAPSKGRSLLYVLFPTSHSSS